MNKRVTRLLSLGVIVLAASMTVAQARTEIQYPWCVQYSSGRHGIGASSWAFDTLQQCRQTASGLGGFCYQNPLYAGPLSRRGPLRR